jgi:excisionase family DNA binding protein
VTPAELLAAQMVAADPSYAREVAESLAQYLLERILAGRRVDPKVREFVAALRCALSGQSEPVPLAVPAEPAPADSWLTIEQVCEAVGWTDGYARRLCRRGPDGGGLEAVKVGTSWTVRRADLDAYLERRRRRQPA